MIPPLERLAWDNKLPVLFNQEKGQEQCESALGDLRGEAFDRAFLPLLVEDLQRFTELTRRCASGSGAVAERKLAADMLPVLRQQLRDARRLLKNEGEGGRSPGRG